VSALAPTASSDVAHAAPKSTALAAETPHLIFGGQDEACVVDEECGQNTANIILDEAQQTGVTQWRMMVTHSRMRDPLERAKMDTAAKLVSKHDMQLNIAIGCAGTWQHRKFLRYLKHIVNRYPAHTYALCNEPEQGGWQGRIPNKDAYRSFCSLFVRGYRTIRHTKPKANVIYGNISPHGLPFWHHAMRCMKRSARHRHKPFKVFAVGVNPYQFTNSPTLPTPEQDGQEQVGIGNIRLLEKRVKRAYKLGVLATRHHAPKLAIGEFAYQSGVGGEHAYRNIDATTMAVWTSEFSDVICNDKNIKSFSWYQWAEAPPGGSRDVWNTPILQPNLQPTPALQALSFKVKTQPCFEA
jgi:hypothetical protein